MMYCGIGFAPELKAAARCAAPGSYMALDNSNFTEAHELDRKWKVAKEMVGQRLSQEEAKRLLAKLE
jgi:hypothetical protein